MVDPNRRRWQITVRRLSDETTFDHVFHFPDVPDVDDQSREAMTCIDTGGLVPAVEQGASLKTMLEARGYRVVSMIEVDPEP